MDLGLELVDQDPFQDEVEEEKDEPIEQGTRKRGRNENEHDDELPFNQLLV